MIVPVMAISNLVLTQQIYSEETNGAHAHYREPVPLRRLVLVFIDARCLLSALPSLSQFGRGWLSLVANFILRTVTTFWAMSLVTADGQGIFRPLFPCLFQSISFHVLVFFWSFLTAVPIKPMH